MVALSAVRSANAALASNPPSDDPASTRPFVAVFSGGTSGIGERAVRALAANHGSSGSSSDSGSGSDSETRRPLRVYIIGRKQAVADALIADCLRVCPAGDFRFVRSDSLALLKNVDRACAEVLALERAAAEKGGHVAKIDLLVATQGVLYIGGRQDTTEGIEEHVSLMYYSRIRLVTQLLPLLAAGPPASPPGHVVSVMNPNLEGELAAADLSLRDPRRFGFSAYSSHVALFTTFAFEALAARHAGRLSLSHYYPSLVMTDLAAKSPLPRWMSLLWRAAALLTRFFAVPDEECGQRVLFMAQSGRFPAAPVGGGGVAGVEAEAEGRLGVAVGADGVVGSGAYRVNWNGEIIPAKKQTDAYRREGMVDKVWEHTMAAFAAVDAGKAFDG